MANIIIYGLPMKLLKIFVSITFLTVPAYLYFNATNNGYNSDYVGVCSGEIYASVSQCHNNDGTCEENEFEHVFSGTVAHISGSSYNTREDAAWDTLFRNAKVSLNKCYDDILQETIFIQPAHHESSFITSPVPTCEGERHQGTQSRWIRKAALHVPHEPFDQSNNFHQAMQSRFCRNGAKSIKYNTFMSTYFTKDLAKKIALMRGYGLPERSHLYNEIKRELTELPKVGWIFSVGYEVVELFYTTFEDGVNSCNSIPTPVKETWISCGEYDAPAELPICELDREYSRHIAETRRMYHRKYKSLEYSENALNADTRRSFGFTVDDVICPDNLSFVRNIFICAGTSTGFTYRKICGLEFTREEHISNHKESLVSICQSQNPGYDCFIKTNADSCATDVKHKTRNSKIGKTSVSDEEQVFDDFRSNTCSIHLPGETCDFLVCKKVNSKKMERISRSKNEISEMKVLRNRGQREDRRDMSQQNRGVRKPIRRSRNQRTRGIKPIR